MEVLTRCLKCLETMSSSASVALVESRVTIGLRVIIWLTGVICGSSPSAVTYYIQVNTHRTTCHQRKEEETSEPTLYAKSFAVKIPLSPSSSSTTRTQSVRLAAHS